MYVYCSTKYIIHMDTSSLLVKGCNIKVFARRLWPSSREGSLLCHTWWHGASFDLVALYMYDKTKGTVTLSYCWFPEIHTIYLINASTCTIDFLYFANECFIEHLISAGYQLFCWSGRWFMHDLNIKYVQFKYCLPVLSYEGCFLYPYIILSEPGHKVLCSLLSVCQS